MKGTVNGAVRKHWKDWRFIWHACVPVLMSEETPAAVSLGTDGRTDWHPAEGATRCKPHHTGDQGLTGHLGLRRLRHIGVAYLKVSIFELWYRSALDGQSQRDDWIRYGHVLPGTLTLQNQSNISATSCFWVNWLLLLSFKSCREPHPWILSAQSE